jgi:hypothetical protein
MDINCMGRWDADFAQLFSLTADVCLYVDVVVCRLWEVCASSMCL